MVYYWFGVLRKFSIKFLEFIISESLFTISNIIFPLYLGNNLLNIYWKSISPCPIGKCSWITSKCLSAIWRILGYLISIISCKWLILSIWAISNKNSKSIFWLNIFWISSEVVKIGSSLLLFSRKRVIPCGLSIFKAYLIFRFNLFKVYLHFHILDGLLVPCDLIYLGYLIVWVYALQIHLCLKRHE